MNSGIRKEDLRIHKFRLYQSTSSGEIEVKLDWQPTLCKLSLKLFYLTSQGLLSLERRLKVLNKFLLSTCSYLFVTGTWLASQRSSVVFPNNTPAQICRSDRSLGKHGGTGAFGWDPSKSTTLTSQFDCGCSTVIEGILFLLIYSPPISSEYRISDDRLTNFIQESLRHYSWSTDDKIILIRDFNFPGFDWSSSPFHDISNYPILSSFLLTNGFSQYVDIVTHKFGNTLDVFLCNFQVSVFIESEFCDHPDHALLHFTLSTQLLLPVDGMIRNSRSRPVLSPERLEYLKLDLSSSLFSFQDATADLFYSQNWFRNLHQILLVYMKNKRLYRQSLPNYFSSHTTHLMNWFSTLMRREFVKSK